MNKFFESILTVMEKGKKEALCNNHSHVTGAVFRFISVKTQISAEKNHRIVESSRLEKTSVQQV